LYALFLLGCFLVLWGFFFSFSFVFKQVQGQRSVSPIK
jgi:hypothetical protein